MSAWKLVRKKERKKEICGKAKIYISWKERKKERKNKYANKQTNEGIKKKDDNLKKRLSTS